MTKVTATGMYETDWPSALGVSGVRQVGPREKERKREEVRGSERKWGTAKEKEKGPPKIRYTSNHLSVTQNVLEVAFLLPDRCFRVYLGMRLVAQFFNRPIDWLVSISENRQKCVSSTIHSRFPLGTRFCSRSNQFEFDDAFLLAILSFQTSPTTILSA